MQRFPLNTSQPPTEIERKNIKLFVEEFAKRRTLDVTIFPENFLKWMELDHVV